MARNKKVSISIRTTPEIKELMRLGAERERRSIASMIEALVVNYARQHNLVQAQGTPEFASHYDNKDLENACAAANERINEEERK